MRRSVLVAGVALALTIAAATPAVAANNPGSCSISGGVVQFNVKEQPTENSVDYVSVASPVRLDLAPHSRVDVYLNSTGEWVTGRYLYSAPVDGDGFWNYRADFDIVSPAPSTGVGRVLIQVKKYNSSSNCFSNVYI